MKKLMLICTIVLMASVASQAQIARVAIRPIVAIRPVCPGPGHLWIDGSWRWDRRLRRNIWVEGYWAPRPHFHRYHGRMRRF